MSAKEYYETLLLKNPEFRKFVEENKDKTCEQLAIENDIDISLLELIWQQAI